VPDARDIGDSLATRGVALALGRTLYDPADPMGKMFFNILATFAEFEVDLLRLRTREGMAIAKSKGNCAASNPSSPATSRPTWYSCRGRRTPLPNSPSCSQSPGPRCTASSNATAPARPAPSDLVCG
jgi:hypothetical protein